jgi:hypothetical protein
MASKPIASHPATVYAATVWPAAADSAALRPDRAADDRRAEHHSPQLAAADDEPIDDAPGDDNSSDATERHPRRVCSLLSAGAADDNADDAACRYAARPADYQPAAAVGTCKSPTRSRSARFILFRPRRVLAHKMFGARGFFAFCGEHFCLIDRKSFGNRGLRFVGKTRTRFSATKWFDFVRGAGDEARNSSSAVRIGGDKMGVHFVSFCPLWQFGVSGVRSQESGGSWLAIDGRLRCVYMYTIRKGGRFQGGRQFFPDRR